MEELVLGRVRHYYTPRTADEGSCQIALVAYVHAPVDDRMAVVNVAGFQHDGETFRRLDVVVETPAAGGQRASFHLTRACPWSR